MDAARNNLRKAGLAVGSSVAVYAESDSLAHVITELRVITDHLEALPSIAAALAELVVIMRRAVPTRPNA